MVARRDGFTVIELLVSIAVVALLVALLLPAVQSVRETARKTQCESNLKQLSLAFSNHESALGRFPSNGWGYLWMGDPQRGTDKRQPGGWIYNLLDYLEQSQRRELGRELTGTEKAKALGDLAQMPLPVVNCPSRPEGELGPWNPILIPRNAQWREVAAKTDYAVNEGDWISDTGGGPDSFANGDGGKYLWKDLKRVTGVCYQRSEMRYNWINDGASNTYLVGEKYVSRKGYDSHDDPGHDQPMYSGVDLDLNRWTIDPPMQDAEAIEERRFGSAHADGCFMGMCDGSVRFIGYTIDRDVHRRLGNRKDGGAVQVP